MSEAFFSTKQAAERARISRQTLYTWIGLGRFIAPRPVRVGNRSLRLWTAADVARLIGVRKLIYRENGGRPRKEGRTHA